MVVAVEAVPVRAEHIKTVGVDIGDATESGQRPVPAGWPCSCSLERKLTEQILLCHIHALGASRHPPALLHAVELAPAIGVGLALHVVVIVVAAPGTDEEGGREKRSRAGTDLLDLRDRVRKGGGVVVEMLVEPGHADVVSSA